MKSNTLSMRIKKAWPTVLQPMLLLLAVLVGVGSFVLVASGKQKSAKAPEDWLYDTHGVEGLARALTFMMRTDTPEVRAALYPRET